MGTKDLILAIDNGTQSLKALIFDLQGQLVAKEVVTFKPYYSEQPAWAEQDPEIFWQALCKACNGLWDQQPSVRDRIAGVAPSMASSPVPGSLFMPFTRRRMRNRITPAPCAA